MNREDFPILQRKVNSKQLIYFDNAATSHKPQQVIDAELNFYQKHNANIHRSPHTLGQEATKAYEQAHQTASDFVNAAFEEIIFTKGSSEALNLLAYSLGNELKEGDEIVISQSEHHSNFVPWTVAARKKKATLKFIELEKDGSLTTNNLAKQLTKSTKIVALPHVSNVLGVINDVQAFSKVIKQESDAKFIVDASQSVPHFKVDVKKLGVDFLAATGHKMCGPMGTGLLYGRKEFLEEMEPFLYGGEMIDTVDFEKVSWNKLPWKFEAGTANVAGAIGLEAAMHYLQKIGLDKIEKHDKNLTDYAYSKLAELEGAEIYGPKENRANLISFNIEGAHAHDVATLLDTEGIAVRAGHHCANPLTEVLNIDASVRASFYLYNTEKEVDSFIAALEQIQTTFKK